MGNQKANHSLGVLHMTIDGIHTQSCDVFLMFGGFNVTLTCTRLFELGMNEGFVFLLGQIRRFNDFTDGARFSGRFSVIGWNFLNDRKCVSEVGTL